MSSRGATSWSSTPTCAILADGPHEEIAAFREFMGHTTPWYSIADVDDPTVGVTGRIACFLRRDDKIHLSRARDERR